MPSIYNMKPRFQQRLRPLMHGLASRGWRPNAITLFALYGSCGVGGLLVTAVYAPAVLLVLPVWLLVRMALNALDGMMARELHMATRRGAVLNELGDVLADAALYLPFALVYAPAQWGVIAFVLGAILTEFCGVLGHALTGTRQYAGPMGKSDRAVLVSALAVLTGCVPAAMALWPWVFGVAALLTALTCWHRLAALLHDGPDGER